MDGYDWARDVSEDTWLAWLAGEMPLEVKDPPAMPSVALQTNFVGQAGVPALRDASCFLNHVAEVADLPQKPEVLDFACGWGRLCRVALRWPWTVVGADSEPSMIQVCNEMLPNEFVMVSNRPPYPFAASRFDLIYAFSLFSHLPESVAVAVLTEFGRILKPHGTVALTLLKEGDALSVWQNSGREFDAAAWKQDTAAGAFQYLPVGGGFESMKEQDYGWAYISVSALQRILKDLPFTLMDRSNVAGVTQDVVILRRT